MNKKTQKAIFQHLIFWIVYLLYEEVIAYFAGMKVEFLSTIVAFMINAGIFYAIGAGYKFLKRRINNKLLLVVASFVVSVLIVVLAAYLKAFSLIIFQHGSFKIYGTPNRILTFVMRNIYFAAMGAAYGFAREVILKEREAAQHRLEKVQMLEQQQKLEKQALQAELNVIKSQINPHFVFNTLGFLYAETYKKLPEVGQSIITLSNIMRYALTKNEDGYSSLESELAYIKDFIKIHESRSKAFFMNINIENVLTPYRVVSLILITLIENMFKHGIFNQNTKEAVLNITVEDGKLHFYSLNYKNNNSVNKVQSNGIGLNYIRERLTDEYGRDGYELLVTETHNSYECKLIMPLRYHESN
ncbi:sensor histidine kinase [Mucilaginibacter endophyticus]|uniref:sensor histidine kinase n=1 Tax=Mucilaginibacter endophyticus TaxID=2675003 RepID=UPI000E0DE87C|nr:histidine kinase [Mucilaginibacter endophyticus]